MTHSTLQDSAVPAVGQQVITACAFIHHVFDGTEKLFLPKRADTKKFLPGVYELPGGHIDFGEELVDGLKREIYEEIGMHLTVGNPFAAFTYLNPLKGSHSVEIIYFAQFSDPLESLKIHPEEHSSFHWVAENELDSVLEKNGEKTKDDPEIQAMYKGFSLLRGEKISG